MFCNKCGAKLDDGAVFCSACGNKMSASPAPAVPKKPGYKFTACTLDFLKYVSLGLFIFHFLHFFFGASVGTSGVYSTTFCADNTAINVCCIIFYSFGIVAAALPLFSKQLSASFPPATLDLLCNKTYISAGLLGISTLFYFIGTIIAVSDSYNGSITFFFIFSILLQIAHILALVVMNRGARK